MVFDINNLLEQLELDRYWSFEGRNGELAVVQHGPDPDFDESTAFVLESAEEIKADIAKLEARTSDSSARLPN